MSPMSASLARCPAEVIHNIFCLLCLHCRGTKCVRDDVDQKTDCNALVALTQTNKLCRNVAMPILFHYPSKHLSSTYIFNVLNCQPKLAQCALSLELSISDNREGRKHCNTALITQMASEMVISRSLREPLVRKGHTSWESSLLLNLCSNITRLAIGEEGALDLHRHNLSQWEGSKLPSRLKYLEINLFIVNSWLCPILSSLLLASPVLDTLVFRGCGTTLWHNDCELDVDMLRPVMERLTDIQLLGHTLGLGHNGSPVLYPLIAAARSLQTFKYILDAHYSYTWDRGLPHGYQHQTPSYVLGMLKAARTSLQHLALDFNKVNHTPLAGSTFISPQEIRQFVHLHTLEIDQICYCRHQLGQQRVRAETWDRDTYLADFLPTTVRRLTIFWKPTFVYFQHQCLNCILYLGKRAVAGDFPNLEIVQIDAPIIPNTIEGRHHWRSSSYNKLLERTESMGPYHEVRIEEAFEGSGVVTRFRMWHATDGVSAYVDGPVRGNRSRAFRPPSPPRSRSPSPRTPVLRAERRQIANMWSN